MPKHNKEVIRISFKRVLTPRSVEQAGIQDNFYVNSLSTVLVSHVTHPPFSSKHAEADNWCANMDAYCAVRTPKPIGSDSVAAQLAIYDVKGSEVKKGRRFHVDIGGWILPRQWSYFFGPQLSI